MLLLQLAGGKELFPRPALSGAPAAATGRRVCLPAANAARAVRAAGTGSRSASRCSSGIAGISSTETMLLQPDVGRQLPDLVHGLVPDHRDGGAVVLELMAKLAVRI